MLLVTSRSFPHMYRTKHTQYVAKIWAQGQCKEQGKLNHIFANIIRSKMNGEDCMYLQGTYKKND